ncbi:GNAT family N-acetyltransferase [Cyanobium sp. LEGE 06113]|uniref:GNAT family N-acetyltransferase n=1 Tax=Cyanobium sp. LEGE 06113 TaxID=1297573 RepID=UPI001D159F3F|nr:GNAT family N-acetyltransferase [Cyanobium sp. LEGE 06113]
MIPLSRALIDDIKPFYFFSNYGLTLFLIPGNTFENFSDEVGLLRELTYRQKLSGSGNNKDLDGRDPFYDHFILVDDATFALAGTARLQFVPVETPSTDPSPCGLAHSSATSYLEHVYPGIKNFLITRGSHLEIGRVAISPAFQRQPASLMTLFRGGLQAAIASGYTAIYGLVSYNHFQYPGSVNDYFLRSLMLSPFRDDNTDIPPARYPRGFRGDERHAGGSCQSIQRLEGETQKQLGSFKLPVLLRQYINLMGAKSHDISVAKDFNQITEILMTADLTKVPRRRLQHFIGFSHAPVYRQFPWFRGPSEIDPSGPGRAGKPLSQ